MNSAIHIRFAPLVLLIITIFSGLQTVYGQEDTEPADTTSRVVNTATASYTLEASGDEITVNSNQVVTVVQDSKDLAIFPSRFTEAQAGQTVTFSHTLINDGNSAAEVRLTSTSSPNDDFDFADFFIKYVTETGQNIVGKSIDLGLASNGTIEFEAQMVVPETVDPSTIGICIVKAESKDGEVFDQLSDTVQVVEGVNMALQKTTTTQEAAPNQVIDFSLTMQNQGDQIAAGIPVAVNGQDQRLVILRDMIPANTTFESVEESDEYRILYHRRGASLHAYRTLPPNDPAEIDAIAFGFVSFVPGRVVAPTFRVRANGNATNVIKNQGVVFFNDESLLSPDDPETVFSNEVEIPLPVMPADIDFFLDSDFEETTNSSVIGEPLHIQADAAGCNINPTMVDTSQIDLESELTGDLEQFLAIEDGTNTGIFRVTPFVPTANANLTPVVQSNDTLEIVEDDQITATLKNCISGGTTTSVIADVLVNPSGTVFISNNNKSVADVRVDLFRASDLQATKNSSFQTTAADPFQTDFTDAEGKFKFSDIPPGQYVIKVDPPDRFIFPSSANPDELPSDRNIDTRASFSDVFELNADNNAIDFDIPIDIDTDEALALKKNADQARAETGDFVDYTLTVTNQVEAELTELTVVDHIPFGFNYENGSTTIDGEKVADPKIGGNGVLTFNLGVLEPTETLEIDYRLRVGPAAIQGDGQNRAIATAVGINPITSNEATEQLQIDQGVFGDQGIIIGGVYYDKNRNKFQDEGEPGIPGVRLYLENGNFIVTDYQGRYSMQGIQPRKHVLKLDLSSLPEGAALELLDNRNAFDPSSRFVDLKKGELHRADFAVCNCEGEVIEEIELRRKAASKSVNSLEKEVQRQLNRQERRPLSAEQRRRKASSGIVNEESAVNFESLSNEPANNPADGAPKKVVQEKTKLDWAPIEVMIQDMEPTLGFVDLSDNDTLLYQNVNIRVKGKQGAIFQLYKNGELIPENRIGKKATFEGIEVWNYVAVDLESGTNDLNLKMVDPFGNVRDSASVQLYAPDEVEYLEIEVPEKGVPADGSSIANVKVSVFDKNNIPLNYRVPVTLSIDYGTFNVKDLEPDRPGIQQFITGGKAEYEVTAPHEAGDGLILVKSGAIQVENTISFIPHLRDLIAAGIVEGTLRLRKNEKDGLDNNDSFEQDLKEFSTQTGDLKADGRSAFFIKGKVLENYLLTARYDSEQDSEEELFRDIRPEQFYPTTGDASLKGFDAQSTGPLFVKVERNKSYAMYGDFQTQDRISVRELGIYNRSQTGGKLNFENNRTKLTAFGADASSNKVFEEFRALGISGPFALKEEDILIKSEQVDIVTRDRDQPSVILDIERLERFQDYIIEPFTGEIRFKSPISSVDQNFNPRFIRIVYETETASNKYVVAGGSIQHKLSNTIEIGGNFITDNQPDDELQLGSSNITVRLGENTRITGETAVTSREDVGEGVAGKVELKHESQRINGRIFAGKSDRHFDNPFAPLSQARTEVGARGNINLGNNTQLRVEALHSANDTSKAVRQGGVIDLKKGLTNYLDGTLGVRYANNRSAQNSDGETETANIRSRFDSRLPFLESASLFAEAEQSLTESGERLVAMGGEYQVSNRAKAFARHEFISSVQNSRFALDERQQQNQSIIGLEGQFLNNGSAYSEYRQRDVIDGKNAVAAIGLRNKFDISEGFGLQLNAERVFTVSGDGSNDGTSIGIGTDYTAAKNWKGSARFEARFTDRGNTYLNTLGYGLKLNDEWSFLAKNLLSIEDRSGDRLGIRQRLRGGFAFRDQTKHKINTLTRYEFKFEQGATQDRGPKRTVHIFSGHLNYHFNQRTTLSGRAATKFVNEKDRNIDSDASTYLLQSRLIYDLTDRFDIGLRTGMLTSRGLNQNDFGAGAEVGFVLAKNVRLAAGYNVMGYRDEDFNENEFTEHGPHLGFSYKFSEHTLKSVLPGRQQSVSPLLTCQENCEELIKQPEPKPTPQIRARSIPFTNVPVAQLQPFEIKQKAELQFNTFLPFSIHFGLDESKITSKSADLVDHIAQYLIDNPNFTVILTAHTDSRSSAAYNKLLAQRRAMATKAYLVGAGIDPSRINVESAGESQLLIENEENVIHTAVNRRVEFNVESGWDPEQETYVRTIEDINIEDTDDFDIDGSQPKNKAESDTAIVARYLTFEADGTELSPSTKAALLDIAEILNSNKKYELKLQGIFSQSNLFDARKNAVYTLMKKQAIDSSRIQTEIIESDGMDEIENIHYLKVTILPEGSVEYNEELSYNNKTEEIENEELELGLAQVKQMITNIKDWKLSEKNVTKIPALPSSIHFPYRDYQLDNISKGLLSRVGKFMEEQPKAKLELYGYNQPDENRENAHKRSKAVYDYLLNWGISANRISISTTHNDLALADKEVEISKIHTVQLTLTGIDKENYRFIDQEFDVKQVGYQDE